VLLQLGVGASPVPWATLAVGYGTAGAHYFVPGYLPAGTKVSTRVLSHNGASAKLVSALYTFPPDLGLGQPVSLGANPVDARGVLIPWGGLNLPSPWAAGLLTEALTTPIDLLTICVQGGGDASLVGAHEIFDVGVGPPGAEVVVATFGVLTSSNEVIVATTPSTVAVSIPAGSRVCARHQGPSSANAALDVCIVGAGFR